MTVRKVYKRLIISYILKYGSFITLLCVSVSFAQSDKEIILPKADIHIGISPLKGSYIGTNWQVADKVYFEASYGKSIGLLFLQVTNDMEVFTAGINYDFHYFLLNVSYVHLEENNSSFSHIAALNINFFSLDEPGFHFIAGLGGFYELAKYFSDKSKKGGVSFNIAIGLTIL